MKNTGCITLELLYEQVVKKENFVLKKEVEYAKIIAEHAIEDLTKSIERRIHNQGKIKGERLGNFVEPKVKQTEQLFKNEPTLISSVYGNFVRYDVFSSLIYFTAHRAYGLEPKNIKMVILYPQMLIQYKGEESRYTIPLLDKPLLKEKLQETIEEVFVVRYNECVEPNNQPVMRNQWAEWRKEKIKYEKLASRLPELEGIF